MLKRPSVVELQRAERIRNVRLFTCPNHMCNWFRELLNDPEWKKAHTHHPIYGIITYKRMAELDIENHDCRAHMYTSRRVRSISGDPFTFVDKDNQYA